MNRLLILFLLFPIVALSQTIDEDLLPSRPASDITAVTTDFDGNLSASDSTVQAALETLDELAQVSESSVVGALDGATLTDAGTPASDDKILLQDTSAANGLKYASFSEFGGGGVDYTTIQTSSGADGASNTAFRFDTDNPFSLGNLFDLSNNASLKFQVDNDGSVATAGDFTGVGTTQVKFISYAPRASTVYIQDAAGEWRLNTDSLTKGLKVGYTATGRSAKLTPSGLELTYDSDKFIGTGSTSGDLLTYETTLAGQSASSGATTNVNGGALNLTGGASATGSGNGGDVVISGGTGTTANGEVILAAKDSAPASLSNSQIVLSLDEVNDKLIVTAKYSDGTNKTFEVAANP